jgi:hypothetical protein
MKLIKLYEDYDHYVIITDEKINVDDIVLETYVDGSIGLEHIQTLNEIDPSTQKKVTHTSIPIVGLCLIDEDELRELLGGVDLTKKAEEVFPYKETRTDYATDECRRIYKTGYNQALSDNKDRKYTEEDVIAIVEKSRSTGLTAEYLIQSLQPPTSWDVEFVNSKLKLV